MRTTKPISTISYNTIDFLYLKLNELLKAQKISFFAFIPHKSEDDEKKDHIHVFIEPARLLQTEELRMEFLEIDPDCVDKPLGCIAFQSSKFGDWCLYALHDKRYLACKGQTRKYHYCLDEFFASDLDDFLFRFRTIDTVALTVYQDILDAINAGLSFRDFLLRGTININQVNAVMRVWDVLSNQGNSTYRNGRAGHDDCCTPSDQEPPR